MLVNYSSSSSEEESEDVAVHNRKRQRPNGKDVSPPLRKRECTGGKSGMENSERVDGAVEKRESSSCQAVPRLPLPASLLNMFQDSEEQHVDDCSQHGGRLRSFQHERGNWATYVYLPYEPDDVFLELLDELRAGAEAHGVILTLAEEFHVSVSRTVVLRHHWIQTFVQSLRKGLAQCRSFVCLADKLKVYTNDERTRTFLGMEVSTGCPQLLEAAKRVDETMDEFKLSTFYKDPSFHVSLAWCVGDLAEKLQGACLSELQVQSTAAEQGPMRRALSKPVDIDRFSLSYQAFTRLTELL
ncbi:U6 snRNA phosphodiesterase isoform X2 [Pygocentrus nattereri]|nr:U6 snRNA phosphodiesterase isoform X2 [Pygocentrus nattereri]XP_037396249.1 U6 snRNA phosphodiesterase isoform X2 [Pygocentrus nattereri]